MCERFIKLMDSREVEQLLYHEPDCFLLLTTIALRAKRTNSFSALGLKPGQALIGDCLIKGFTQQKYRTTKNKLENWGFSSFEGSRRGTVATLLTTGVYNINKEGDGEEKAKTTTITTRKQGLSNEEPITYNGNKKGNNNHNNNLATTTIGHSKKNLQKNNNLNNNHNADETNSGLESYEDIPKETTTTTTTQQQPSNNLATTNKNVKKEKNVKNIKIISKDITKKSETPERITVEVREYVHITQEQIDSLNTRYDKELLEVMLDKLNIEQEEILSGVRSRKVPYFYNILNKHSWLWEASTKTIETVNRTKKWAKPETTQKSPYADVEFEVYS